MPHMKLILDGDGAWSELISQGRESDIIHLPEPKIEVCVLAHGMASGAPSIAMRIDLPDGKVVIAETSWALFAAAARGIAARYGWP